MAVLVHDVVTEAMTLNLHGGPAEAIVNANGTALTRGRNKVRHD